MPHPTQSFKGGGGADARGWPPPSGGSSGSDQIGFINNDQPRQQPRTSSNQLSDRNTLALSRSYNHHDQRERPNQEQQYVGINGAAAAASSSSSAAAPPSRQSPSKASALLTGGPPRPIALRKTSRSAPIITPTSPTLLNASVVQKDEGTGEESHLRPLSDADVLCGRGGLVNGFVGNIAFRDLVAERRDEYRDAEKMAKTLIAQGIVDKIKSRGGLFLHRVDIDGKSKGGTGDAQGSKWADMSEAKARVKTSQALREGAEVRKSSTSSRLLTTGSESGSVSLASATNATTSGEDPPSLKSSASKANTASKKPMKKRKCESRTSSSLTACLPPKVAPFLDDQSSSSSSTSSVPQIDDDHNVEETKEAAPQKKNLATICEEAGRAARKAALLLSTGAKFEEAAAQHAESAAKYQEAAFIASDDAELSRSLLLLSLAQARSASNFMARHGSIGPHPAEEDEDDSSAGTDGSTTSWNDGGNVISTGVSSIPMKAILPSPSRTCHPRAVCDTTEDTAMADSDQSIGQAYSSTTAMSSSAAAAAADAVAAAAGLQARKRNRGFLFHLNQMLSDPANHHAIEWDAGGIIVHNPHALETDVLCKYFRHSNYSSFTRQLTNFGFTRASGKGKMGPCSYTNDATTADLGCLLNIRKKMSGLVGTTSSVTGLSTSPEHLVALSLAALEAAKHEARLGLLRARASASAIPGHLAADLEKVPKNALECCAELRELFDKAAAEQAGDEQSGWEEEEVGVDNKAIWGQLCQDLFGGDLGDEELSVFGDETHEMLRYWNPLSELDEFDLLESVGLDAVDSIGNDMDWTKKV